MIKIKEIKTEIEILKGRDSIFINKIESKDYNNLKIYGEFNLFLEGENNDIPFKIEFLNVICYFACELDTYENIKEFKTESFCSFGIVENSKYLNNLPIRKDFQKQKYKHYIFRAYDITFNIISTNYKLVLI